MNKGQQRRHRRHVHIDTTRALTAPLRPEIQRSAERLRELIETTEVELAAFPGQLPAHVGFRHGEADYWLFWSGSKLFALPQTAPAPKTEGTLLVHLPLPLQIDAAEAFADLVPAVRTAQDRAIAEIEHAIGQVEIVLRLLQPLPPSTRSAR